jgi:uncharacterized protein YndB with AHSA1/START domain
MTEANFRPSPPAEVDRRRDGQSWTLVFVRELRHPPEQVWAALTDPAQLRGWAPFTSDRDLGSLGEATLTMIDAADAETLPASVSRAERPSLLEYTWGTDLLRWSLVAVASGTRLTLEHTVSEPDWLPKVAAGWHLCLDVAERLLDGRPVPPIRGEAAMSYGWERLHETYAERLQVDVAAPPAGSEL